MRRVLLAYALAAMSGLCGRPSHAMDFKMLPADGGAIILGIGRIEQGDRVKLVTAIDSVPFGQRVFALALNSPGGSIVEAEKMGQTIRSSHLVVAIPSGSICASACFLLFAAAPTRMAAPDAHIGVHSVAEGSTETLAAMGFTTAMAREAAGYGVPSSIIGRMVTTEPGQMAWLTTAELVTMGTTFLPMANASSPAPRQYAAPASPPVSAPTAPSGPQALAQPTMNPPSLAFQQGAADRRGWEAWIGSLGTDARAGADFWAAQRSLKVPSPCAAPAGPFEVGPTSWEAGCVAAQTRLRAIDARRKGEPDYRAGWNSL